MPSFEQALYQSRTFRPLTTYQLQSLPNSIIQRRISLRSLTLHSQILATQISQTYSLFIETDPPR